MTEESDDSSENTSQLSKVIEDSATPSNSDINDRGSKITSDDQEYNLTASQNLADSEDPNGVRKLSNASPLNRQNLSSKSPSIHLNPDNRSNRGSVKMITPSSKALVTPPDK